MVMMVRYLLTRFSVGYTGKSFNVITKIRHVVHQVTPAWDFAEAWPVRRSSVVSNNNDISIIGKKPVPGSR